jgi:hypothetical protein
MVRRKRTSKAIEQANQRLNGMKTIDPKLDLGGGLTVEALEKAIESAQTKLDSYNLKLSEVDDGRLSLEADEKVLDGLNGRVLAGTGAVYGRNSKQYELVGGIPPSERKRSSGKKGSGSSSNN